MFDNIGGKIKGLAQVTFVVEAIAAFITGITLMALDAELIPIGLLVIVVGPLVAWASSWLLYGFGELIDKICDIERNTRSAEEKNTAQSKVDAERISKIEKWRALGIISEEEYQQLISEE